MFDNLALWLDQAHFLRPWWLLALLPAVLLLLALWFRRRHAGLWQDVVEPHLLPYLLEGEERPRRRAPLWGLLALWTLAIVALAGPAWTQLPEPVQKSGSALVVAWDMSPSMMAQDLKPSRLQRSRLKLIDLLRARREGTTGLVAYAGEAHVVTPLTDDAETIISLLPALTPANMPLAGSNPEMALEMTFQLLQDAGIPRGDVLLVTDEIVPDAFDRLSRIARRSDHQVSIWGVGTEDGAPIPLPQGGFARTRTGEIVVPKLNEDALQDFAADINAYYMPLLQSDEDIETLLRLFDTQPAELRETDRVFDNWYEHGPWLLILALPLGALAFRRGWVMAFALVALVPLSLPQTAQALTWEDLWKKPDQQGLEALREENPEEAARLFENPNWRGTALYRAGDYEAALEAFRRGENSARSSYNQGNAHMRLGNYEAALEAYDEALQRNPEHQDARHNRQLAQRLLQQQESQKQESQQQGEGSGEQSQDGQQNQQQDSEGGGDDSDGQGQTGEQPRDGGEDPQQGSTNGSGSQHPEDDPTNNRTGQPDDEQMAQGDQDQGENGQDEAGAVDDPDSEQEARQAQPEQSGQPGQAEQPGEAEQNATAQGELSEAEREQQQALEQWLRRVPDDPGGLIRNKFQHEYRERRLTGDWEVPDNNATQRW